MLKSLLVATDLSVRSERAVRRAVRLAQSRSARLTVLHVVGDDLPDARLSDAIEGAERELAAQAEGFGATPGSCEIVVAAGHAFGVIAEAARSRDVDLIVMGAHRRQMLRDVFVGTTIERVTRTAGRPVLMANGASDAPWRRIVVAVDLSEASAHAARTAIALGFPDGAEVTFAHAYAPITRMMMTYAGIPPERVHEEAEREFEAARREMARFLDTLELGDLAWHARLVEGVGAEAIAGLVAQARPDLLVIGTRGLSGAKRLFLGSVAQELMGSLEIDVLAVPPGA